MNDSSSRQAATEDAPGTPGIPPTWASSAKDTVGCSLGPARLWFTIGGGIVNEVYHPRADIPQIRDLGFIVADGKGFWIEVKRLGTHTIRAAALGIPAVTILHKHDRFELQLRVSPDPSRDVLLIEVALSGSEDLLPYVLLSPHLGGTGHGNRAEIAMHRGRRMLWAEQGPFGLALAAADAQQRDACARASAGCVGVSDGWQDFARNGAMTWEYQRAGPGNVALTAELPRHAVLCLGLASSKESAATLALSALMQPFDRPWQQQIDDWNAWHARWRARCAPPVDLPEQLREQYVTSAMVLRCHQDKTYPGAMVASLSVPWGNSRDERGGYHLIWPRDLVQCATALLALGAEHSARDILRYLMATQHEDGHWNQNQWLGGKPYWEGIQLDEAAFPVLLAAALAERGALDGIRAEDMVRRALSFIVCTGSCDGWSSAKDTLTADPELGLHAAALDVSALPADQRLEFALFDRERNAWSASNHIVVAG